MFKQRIVFGIAALILGSIGCDSSHTNPSFVEPSPQNGPQQPQQDPTAFTLGFESMTEFVFRPHRCLNCHSEAGGNRGNTNLETYVSAFPKANKIESLVLLDIMPLTGPPVPAWEKSILSAWVDAGAPETSNEPLPEQL